MTIGARPVAIYALLNTTLSDCHLPMYVGQTVSPRTRFRDHMGPSCHSAELASRIREYFELSGRAPEMRILEWCSPEQASARERYWIGYVISLGWSPANIIWASHKEHHA